jgi:iron-sulfur cluster protein
MVQVTAILSMLHEPPARNSATRLFRGRPVLGWTLGRLGRCRNVASSAVMCWADQAPAAGTAARGAGARVIVKGPREALPQVEAVSAARRWADGWRGGLLATCDFDLGFYGPFVREAVAEVSCGAILLVDPAAGLVDPGLVDAVAARAAERPELEYCFAPAAPGLCGTLLRPALVERLAATRTHPGRLMHYHPDQVSREPLAGEACVPVPAPVARTTHRFTLSSDRQVARVAAATESLNGQLMSTSGEELVHRLSAVGAVDPLPREVVLELTTARLSRPVFWPGRYREIRRPDLSLADARVLMRELSSLDDTRLTLAGVGDPLLSPAVFATIEAASAAGLAVHVETDLLSPDPLIARRLAASPADVVSVHLPAMNEQTYEAVMGVNGYRRVLENLQAFVTERAALGRGVPVLAPLFTKCAANLAEMEPWYDQWLRAVGSAVITGPSDFAGLVPDVSVADMSPPRRKACARLSSRLTILSDGRIVSCEQDVLGRQVLGSVGGDALADVWQKRMAALREEHRCGNWTSRPVCGSCKEWHRP